MKKFLFVLAFAALAVQASAVEFSMGPVNGNLYGMLDFAAYYQYDSQDFRLMESGHRESDGSFHLSFDSDSRVGVELSYGRLSGVFEIGANYDEYLRLYYVQYDFGKAGSISFGKQGTIANYSFGQEAYEGNCLIGYGAVDDFRLPMLMYSVAGFQIAVIHSGDDFGLGGLGLSYVEDPNNPESPVLLYETKRNQYMPRVELAYTYSNDFLEAKVYGAYAHYSEKVYGFSPDGGDRTFERDLYLIGLGGTYNFMNAFVQIGAFYGSNLAMANMLGEKLSPWYRADKDELEEVNSWGAAIGFGYTIAEKYTPQIGFGYTSSDSEGWSKTNDAMSAYLNAILQFTDNFALIPEVSWFDEMQDNAGNNEGYRIYAGLIARVTF